MIVTTTNSIEGREISRYNDPIAANVVIGTNVFSDIGASYVDFFEIHLLICRENIDETFKNIIGYFLSMFFFAKSRLLIKKQLREILI